MRKKIEDYYEDVDNALEKIEKRIKTLAKNPEIKPVILNFDEVPLWYHKKP